MYVPKYIPGKTEGEISDWVHTPVVKLAYLCAPNDLYPGVRLSMGAKSNTDKRVSHTVNLVTGFV